MTTHITIEKHHIGNENSMDTAKMMNVLIVVSKQCENTVTLVEKPIIANWSQTDT
jgi:hypothetical protein